MTTADDVDSYLIKSELPYDQIGEGTWVLRPDSTHGAQIGVKIEDPILLLSIQMFELPPELSSTQAGVARREHLFRRLLELNSELLHAAYSLQGERVVLSGAHQLENLDFNEFQAMVDDMCMALDNHFHKIAPMVAADRLEHEATAEGRA